ncbi:calcium-binding protein [Amaricoccus tamworthensis]|uniref:calcium-binding protein n=1 Tax=Amaricoccus tamworthensis TaxID=57002 RepID=UPI003C7BDA32
MSKVVFNAAKAVKSGFSIRDTDIWELATESAFPTGRYDSFTEETASGGSIIISGDFYREIRGGDEWNTGDISSIILEDDKGKEILEIKGMDSSLEDLIDQFDIHGNVESKSALKAIYGPIFDDVTEVRLSNKNDRVDIDDVTLNSAAKIRGLDGDDRIAGNGGKNFLNGDRGDDVLRGKGGSDKLWGGRGDDDLRGGSGRDRLDGGKGSDVLTGGGGADTFVFRKGQADGDRVTDFHDGSDLIRMIGFDGFDDLSVRQKDYGLVIRSGDDRIVLEDVLKDDISAADFLF